MLDKLSAEHQIGRRISLRHLHIFVTVARRGSMAQAAVELGVSQPAVSEVIAELERTLGVLLFDRSARGVKPTMYARAMLDRSVAAFDELKQGIRTLEDLADPTAGELRVGCVESVTSLMLPPIIGQFMRQYPRVTVHVQRLSSATPAFPDLSERNLDLVLGRMVKESPTDTELAFEPLFDDRSVIVAGAHSRWARRRKVDLGDLVDEPWVLAPPECRTHIAVMAAFRARGLKLPHVALMAYSIPLRMSLAASGRYITVFAESIRSLDQSGRAIRVLPIDLPTPPTLLAIVTLKSRKLSPIAQRFVEHLRNCAADPAVTQLAQS